MIDRQPGAVFLDQHKRRTGDDARVGNAQTFGDGTGQIRLTGAKRPYFRLLHADRGIDRIVVHASLQVSLVHERLGVPRDKLALVPYCADPLFWAPRPFPEEPLVVSAGREHRDYKSRRSSRVQVIP